MTATYAVLGRGVLPGEVVSSDGEEGVVVTEDRDSAITLAALVGGSVYAVRTSGAVLLERDPFRDVESVTVIVCVRERPKLTPAQARALASPPDSSTPVTSLDDLGGPSDGAGVER